MRIVGWMSELMMVWNAGEDIEDGIGRRLMWSNWILAELGYRPEWVGYSSVERHMCVLSMQS